MSRDIQIVEPVIPPLGNYRLRGEAGKGSVTIKRNRKKRSKKGGRSLAPMERPWSLRHLNAYMFARGMR